jgi:protein-L-isoaspartate(D-aspartate) O-methyltransferase
VSNDPFAELRQRMLQVIAAKTIFSCAQLGRAALRPRVLEALATVPRHEFVPPAIQPYAYEDCPLPIGCGKTISQPFIVAVMTDLLDLQPTDRVLEVGTGLGYQTAVLAALAGRVYSVELIEELAAQAIHRLARQRCANVEVSVGDGANGWPVHAPYDKVIVTAAPASIPPALVEQLKPGGRMVLPAGPPDEQQLTVLDKSLDGTITSREIFAVRFSLLA